ncbi:partial Deoxyribodipyrimidine photo-lyase, partial [biofilm metagenome]
FSRNRDHELAQTCRDLGIAFHSVPDYLLVEPEQAIKNNGYPYQVFTPFYNNARRFPVALPKPLINKNFINITDGCTVNLTTISERLNLMGRPLPTAQTSGRKDVLGILEQLPQHIQYHQQCDYPALNATTRLSAHLKFGTCSVREAYYAILQHLSQDHPLLRQLYWRDFFSHIAFHYPHVFGKAFHSRYDNLAWDVNMDTFQRWCNGTTGFPIVDAGMRELNATGFMHNRVRMITASFLTKDLHIDWRWGERYFAQHLVDYDPAINNGNWQWAASTGCDAQPYFRIFNPWLQQQKFDAECRYITRWIPELSGLPASVIHNWYRQYTGTQYPVPMVDHQTESKIAKTRFSVC